MARITMCVCVAVALWASPAAAFKRPRAEPDAKARGCPEVGDGYVRVPGSSTCVKVGGSVRVEGMAIGRGR